MLHVLAVCGAGIVTALVLICMCMCGTRRTVNYIDSTYTAAESHKRYYPTHTDRLETLKNKYDPKRVINFPQDF